MKKHKFALLWICIIMTGALVLSGCTGGAGIASSWPGVFVDSAAETIFIASNTHVYAVNAVNGSEKWRFPQKAEPKKTFFAPPSLTADGQLIQGGYDHGLYSINAQNGQQNWVFTDADDKFIGAAFTTAEMIFAPNTNKNLYALTTSGALKWKFTADHALWLEPEFDGERLFVASMDHHVYALDPASGQVLWKSDDLGGAIVHSLSLTKNGRLFVGTIGANLSALEAASGKLIWQVDTKGWVWSKPVVGDEGIFVADQEGIVYSVDPANGSIRWQIQPDTGPNRAIISTPILIDKTLYFASQAGVLYAVNTSDGRPVWNRSIGGKILTDLASIDDLMIVAPMETDALLIALDHQGNNVWSFVPAK